MTTVPQSPHTVRVALLICGGLSGPVLAANGDYYEVYTRFLKNSLPPGSDTELVSDGFEVKDMKYPEDDRIPEYDMIMLTGSGTFFLLYKRWSVFTDRAD